MNPIVLYKHFDVTKFVIMFEIKDKLCFAFQLLPSHKSLKYTINVLKNKYKLFPILFGS